jgi:DnaJ-class molecular chaperone
MIAIWGISKGQGLKEIEQMYEDLFFATIFYTLGYYHEEECDECNGNGSVDCAYCDGRGDVTCDECNGDGDITCDECDGEGEVDDGGDMVPCTKCDGEGYESCDNCDDGHVTCGECSGNGTEDCNNCDGSGTLESDSTKDYSIQFIASWSKNLKNKCELEQQTLNSITSYDKFNRNNKIMVLATDDDDAELEDEVKDNRVYCIDYFGDTAKLNLNFTSDITFRMVDYDDTHLIL